MCLKEALEKIADDKEPILLRDHRQDWEASDLLLSLSAGMLKRQVAMLPGFYIAALSESGLMGEVLYRLKSKS
jgi:hypothetical protein